MNAPPFPTRRLVFAFLGMLWLAPAGADAAVATWSGGGADTKWTTAANWGGTAPGVGDVLVFPSGAPNKATSNDFAAGTLFASIQIDDSGYAFGGNAIRLGGGMTAAYTSGSVTFPLDTALGSSASFAVAGGGTLRLAGIVSEVSAATGLSKSGAGTLELDAANAYTGMTTVNNGTLRLNRVGGAAIAGSLTIGDGAGAAGTAAAILLDDDQLPATAVVTVLGDGSFALNGFGQTIAALHMTGGEVATGTGVLTLDGNVNATSVTLAGSGLPATISGNLHLSAAGEGTRTFAIDAGPAAVDLDVAATITGESLDKEGAGTLQLSGSAADNTFRYLFALDGRVLLYKTGGHVAVKELAVGRGSDSSVFGTVRFLAGDQINPTKLLHVWTSAVLDLNGFNQTIADATFQGGKLTTGAGTLTVTGSVSSSIFMQEAATIEGNLNLGGGVVNFLVADALSPGTPEFVVTGIIANGGLRQDIAPAALAPGTLDLRGANTYGGTTTVDAGTLLVNGSIASNTALSPNARLGGSGRIAGFVHATGSTIAPGNSPGILRVGDVAFDSAATLAIEVGGTAAGTQYDQLDVAGTVSLGAAALDVSLGYAPQGGDSFTIIRNDGADPVTGTFAGLPEGATLTANGVAFSISYRGGDGNDVVLTAKRDQTIAFANPGPQGLRVGSVDLGVSSSSGLPVAIASNSLGTCTVSAASVTLLAIGICDLTATQAGDGVYNAALPVDQSFAIVAEPSAIPTLDGRAMVMLSLLLGGFACARSRRRFRWRPAQQRGSELTGRRRRR